MTGKIFSAERHFLWLILAAKFCDKKFVANLALPPLLCCTATPPLWTGRNTLGHCTFFSLEASQHHHIIKNEKWGLLSYLIYIDFHNWCETWVLQLGFNCHMTSPLPLSHAIKLPFLIIIIYCSLNVASKSASYNNSGRAKINRRSPALSCLGFGDLNNTVLKKNAEWRMYIFPLSHFLCHRLHSLWLNEEKYAWNIYLLF